MSGTPEKMLEHLLETKLEDNRDNNGTHVTHILPSTLMLGHVECTCTETR